MKKKNKSVHSMNLLHHTAYSSIEPNGEGGDDITKYIKRERMGRWWVKKYCPIFAGCDWIYTLPSIDNIPYHHPMNQFNQFDR